MKNGIMMIQTTGTFALMTAEQSLISRGILGRGAMTAIVPTLTPEFVLFAEELRPRLYLRRDMIMSW